MCILLAHSQATFFAEAQCALIISPETVILNCASDSEDSVAWVAYSPGSSERKYIFSGHILFPIFSKCVSFSEEKRGHCSLQINATREAAKRYIRRRPFGPRPFGHRPFGHRPFRRRPFR